MLVALCAFAIVSLCELAMYLPLFWTHGRRPLAAGLLVSGPAVAGWLFVAHLALASGVVVFVALYRSLNLARVVEGRMHGEYLHRVGLRTSYWLIGLQTAALLLWGASDSFYLMAREGWAVLTLAICAAVIILVAIIDRHRRRSLLHLPEAFAADRDLPSITVCIPARNETADLEACLRTLIDNDYPKLEILVLDDQSHDRTPEIIRGFAHDGVRFIKGDTPPTNWLAKNWAYQRLYEEASGEIIVFGGVDVRLGRHSLRALVLAMKTLDATMVSVVPANVDIGDTSHRSVLLQPIRYAWELCVGRPLSKRQPVLSTCWVARKSLLAAAGGFGGVTRSIIPESHFAAAAGRNYRFLQADEQLEIKSRKPFREQLDTAVRMRYPQLHRRPELVLLISVIEVLLFVAPYPLLVYGAIVHAGLIWVAAMIAIIVQTWQFVVVVSYTYRTFLWRSLWILPLAIIIDSYIRHHSMWRYEFGQVIWKDRDVTPPVMHVIPHLPLSE